MLNLLEYMLENTVFQFNDNFTAIQKSNGHKTHPRSMDDIHWGCTRKIYTGDGGQTLGVGPIHRQRLYDLDP